MGAEPCWKDIYSNGAIERDKEKEWIQQINNSVKTNKKSSTPVFVFTGTAGDGKTSIAMRVALDFSNKGRTVGWIDRNSEIDPYKINTLVEDTENLESLFIDTPDMYGREFAQVISSLALKKKLTFLVLILRGPKVDQIIKSPLFDVSIPTKEFNTYKLTDNEINKILDLLEEKNLIGALKGMNKEKQTNIFKNKSDRYLIVAMIEATSGKDFTKKICEEFESLDNDDKNIYCLVAVATAKHASLSKEEILIGMGEDRDNATISIINKLIRRGLLTESNDRLKVRHRVIAENVFERLSSNGQLMIYYETLVYIATVKSISRNSEQNRMKRLLKRLINHEVVFKISPTVGEAQNLYQSIEDLLKNNHHFWLQRGCFELEYGQLHIARNYLNQSSGLNSSDSLVVLSLAHLSFKEAVRSPNIEKAHRSAKEAYNDIVELIDRRGKTDPYPYHVLGTQGLHWAKKGIKNHEESTKYLKNLLSILKKGKENHPRSNKLKDIYQKIHKEVFGFSINN